jgi:acyl-CoA dehydrogenase
MQSQEFDKLLSTVRSIATEVAAKHASDVDAQARFPRETLAALREARILSANVPAASGGAGCSMVQLATICATLSQACASSGMVLAMHFIQVACIARHSSGSVFFQRYLRELVDRQYLLASMTSEVGVFGDTRSSICAVERAAGRFKLDKDATTGSYCAEADAILVTCRRAADAAASDQVLVLVKKGDCKLTQTTSWDTMGMRGTRSPGFKLESDGPEEQIVPGAYADSSAQTMVPHSHILWAALWWGIAAEAVTRASAFVRGQARRSPGTVPPTAVRLAEVSARLQTMRSNWLAVATEFDLVDAAPGGMDEFTSIGWALRFNNLKVSASEMAPEIVHKALQIVGILGYKNDSPFAMSRLYRDALSGSLMVSNDRIAAKTASMLLVFKDE